MVSRKKPKPRNIEQSHQTTSGTAPVRPDTRSAWTALLVCASVTVLFLLPFLNKAIHLDDTLFVYAARQITEHPLDPYGFTINWYGHEMPMHEVTQNGPLSSYYMALVANVLGWTEIALHVAFLVPAVLAAVGCWFLAERQMGSLPIAGGVNSRAWVHFATFCAVLSPVFLVSSTTLMCDITMLALWIWSVLWWIRGIDESKHRWLILSGVLAGAAVTTKYFAVAIVPLLLAYSAFRWREVRWRILYLLIPIAIAILYDEAMYSLYGHSVLLGASGYALQFGAEDKGYLERVLVSLSYTGGCIVAVIFCAPLLWSRKKLTIALILTVATLFFVPVIVDFGASYSDVFLTPALLLIVFQTSVFIVGGASLLVLAVHNAWKERTADSWLLMCWIAGTFAFCSLVNWTVNGRSLLPMAPAAGILIARSIARRASVNNSRLHSGTLATLDGRRAWLLYLPIMMAGALSLVVASADTQWANSGRRAAESLNQSDVLGEKKDVTFFTGHWGFQYYMESLGFRALNTQDSALRVGDIIILPDNNSNVPEQLIDSAIDVSSISFRTNPVLATMRPEVGAGFYASLWGPLPYAIGLVPPEKYRIMTLQPTDLARMKIQQLEATLEGDPDNVGVLNNLAWLLATNIDVRDGAPEVSILMAEKACELTRGQFAECLDTLGVAYAAAGRFPEAIAAARDAIDRAEELQKLELIAEVTARLELYQQQKPYRE